MKHIIFLILFVTVPVSYTADTANKQQDISINFIDWGKVGRFTGEYVYVVLKDRKTHFTIYSLQKGQLTETGFVIVNFEELSYYISNPTARLSIQTDSVRTISDQVVIKYISSKDNIIVLEPTYNVEALEHEVATVKQEYDEAQKAWQEADDTLKPQIKAVREQKFAHLENAKKILEIITQL